jgi:hypothetical protein
MDNNISILIAIEFIYKKLGDNSKNGFVINEIKSKGYENKIRMDEIIDEFELACIPPTLTVLLSESSKKIAELVIKTYKTQNFDEFIQFILDANNNLLGGLAPI